MSVTLNPKTYLEWPDYVFVVSVLVLCTVLGWYFRQKRGQVKVSEFLLASRNLTVIPSAASFAATAVSAYSMTGLTSELYQYGAEYYICYLSAFVAFIFGAYVFVPKFRASKYISVFEMMEERFDSSVRKLFSLLFVLQKVMYISVVLHLSALSLSTLTRFDYKIISFVLGFVCTAYSSLGGLRAVIWTDVIQFVLMFVTMMMVIFQGVLRVGGVDNLWTKFTESGYLTNFHWIEGGETRYTVWSLCLNGILYPFDILLINQAYAQRILGAKSNSTAKVSVILGAFLHYFMMGAIIVVVGAVLYLMYGDCDPTMFSERTGVTRVDQLFIYAIGDLFMDYPVLKGVAISGIVSASLSTISSFLNSFAVLTLEDFVRPIFPRVVRTESAAVLICMISSFSFGIVTTFASLVVPYIGDAVFASGILSGTIRGQMTGAAALVFFYKKFTKRACLFSLLFGMLFNSWLIMGSYLYSEPRSFPELPHSSENCDIEVFELYAAIENITFTKPIDNVTDFNDTVIDDQPKLAKNSIFTPFYQIPWIWYYPIGFFVTVLVGIIFSEISATCDVSSKRPRQNSTSYLHVKSKIIEKVGAHEVIELK